MSMKKTSLTLFVGMGAEVDRVLNFLTSVNILFRCHSDLSESMKFSAFPTHMLSIMKPV